MSVNRRMLGLTVLATAGLLALFPGQTTAQTSGDLGRISESGTITIGIHNRSPWGFRDEDGTVTGFSPTMLKAAFEPLGVKNVEFTVMDFGALIPSLLSQRIDAVASGMAVTPARCEQVIFSDPDLAIGDGLLVRKGNPLNIQSYQDIVDNPEIRLGGGRGSSNSENAMKAGVPESQMQLFQDIESGVAALIADRVDAMTFSAPTVMSILRDPNVKGLERAEPFQGLIDEKGIPVAGYASIAFHPDDAALRDAYNERRKEMHADGTLGQIMEQFGFTPADAAPVEITAKQICPDNYR